MDIKVTEKADNNISVVTETDMNKSSTIIRSELDNQKKQSFCVKHKNGILIGGILGAVFLAGVLIFVLVYFSKIKNNKKKIP